ncbi:MAG TPA: alpha/beta hydrolase [Actinomycetota bacterium]|nr:alpha/beta hydrolase [Actinomycetota bacterium]
MPAIAQLSDPPQVSHPPASPSVRATVVRGRRIVYEIVGAGDPTIVLIHGAFCHRGYYAGQVEHLSRRHRVLTIDLPGHGESATPESGFGVRDFAEDVIGVCEAAGVTLAVLCGHSMPVALEVATLRPDLAAGVVLLDGVVLFPEPVRQGALAALLPGLEGEGWVRALQSFFRATFGPHDAASVTARVMEDLARAPRQMAVPFFRDLMASDSAAELSAGTCPLLYIHAETPTDLERLRRLRPDVLVGRVAGSGHYLTLQVPEQVNAMLDRFLEIIGSRP